MLGAASLLTLVTLTGLVAGFVREWLLVFGWGAGGRTDAYLVAMFVPEAIRTVLAGGLLSSVGLALWNERAAGDRPTWLSSTTASLATLSVLAALCLSVASSFWVALIGPGLAEAEKMSGSHALALLAWVLPGVALQAWWSVPLQSQAHFLRSGFGSLLFNLPAIVYMLATRHAATETGLSLCFVAGSVLMVAPVVGPMHRFGLAPRLFVPRPGPMRELGMRILPLATSSILSQALLLFERVVASYLGEGSLTVLNLARKLVNVPLVALTSLNQVLMGLMSRQTGTERLDLLRRGLATVTIVSLPGALCLIVGSTALVSLLFHAIPSNERIEPLLALYAAALTFAGWNAMLARFAYAGGDTRTPLGCEVVGSGLQAVSLPLFAWLWGTPGLVGAFFVGTLATLLMLVRRQALWGRSDLQSQGVVTSAGLVAGALAMHVVAQQSLPAQVAVATGLAIATCLLLATWLRPWRPSAQAAADLRVARPS